MEAQSTATQEVTLSNKGSQILYRRQTLYMRHPLVVKMNTLGILLCKMSHLASKTKSTTIRTTLTLISSLTSRKGQIFWKAESSETLSTSRCLLKKLITISASTQWRKPSPCSRIVTSKVTPAFPLSFWPLIFNQLA